MSLFNTLFASIEKSLLGLIDQNQSSVSSSKDPTNSKTIKPGDINIKEITLISQDGERRYDLLAQVKGINIYESIMSPVIFADLSVQDSIGLLQDFPILCEEYIAISFETPKTKSEPTKYIFRIRSVSDKQISENNKMNTYTLNLVSAEIIRNSVTRIANKSKLSPSDVVKSILTDDLGTEKPIRIDATKGVNAGVEYAARSPFSAIDVLRTAAISTRYPASSFVFFENKYGYHFVTIERLMEDGAKAQDQGNDVTDKEFFFDTRRNDSVKDMTFRNILAYNQMTFGDSISKLQNGGLTNFVSAYDFTRGNYSTRTYVNNIGQDVFKTADTNRASTSSSNFDRSFGKRSATYRFIPISPDLYSADIQEKLAIQTAYIQTLTQNIVQIYVYGDSDITVGDVIKCNFPASTSFDSNEGLSRLDGGNYLVSKLRHIIMNGDRPQHAMSLELIKGNLTEAA